MATVCYWGEGGEYGPYRMDAEGWPYAGEVMRDYRVNHKHWTAKQFAEAYAKATRELNNARGRKSREGKKDEAMSEEWIIDMELRNRVSTDIKRRRIIAQLLGIPPVLFGLASLESPVFRPQEMQQTIKMPPGPAALKPVSVDLTAKQKNLRLFWTLNYTDTAQDYLGDIQAAIQELEQLEQQTRGSLLLQVQRELLSSYLLASIIAQQDLIQHQVSYVYANKAVRVAKSMGIPPLLGSALYWRGYARLVWGIYGDIDESSILHPDRKKIDAALADFEEALQYAHPQLKGLLSLELSRVKGLLQGSATDITVALSIAEQAEKWVGCQPSEDFDTQVLQTSMGLNEGRLYLGQAVAFNAVGRPGKANEALEALRELKNGKGLPRNHTRRNTWADIVQAETYMGLKHYDMAAYYAKNALAACQDIRSESNIAIITDIYSRLQNSSGKNEADVIELGNMLRKWYTKRQGTLPQEEGF